MIQGVVLAMAMVGSSPAYPADEVLSAFAQTCGSGETLASMEAASTANGWERYTPEPDSLLGELVELGQDMSGGFAGGTYRKEIAGRELHLALSEVEGETTERGCRMYDFAAEQALPIEALAAWAGSQPGDVSGEAFLPMLNVEWGEGVVGNAYKTQILFIPANHPFAEAFGMRGLSFIANYAESRD